MAILLGIDIETTSLQPDMGEVIEVGAVLWDTESSTPLSFYGEIISPHDPIPPEITEITGITNEMVQNTHVNLLDACRQLNIMAMDAHAIVAHNAPFDYEYLRHHIDLNHLIFQRPWIDTMRDVPYPADCKYQNLLYLAAYHGFVNPFPHRAVTDVLTMLKVLSLYDFAEVERYAAAPTVNLITKFPWDEDGERRKKIKSLRFNWNKEGKYWEKPVKAFFVDQEVEKAKALGFTVSTDEL